MDLSGTGCGMTRTCTVLRGAVIGTRTLKYGTSDTCRASTPSAAAPLVVARLSQRRVLVTKAHADHLHRRQFCSC
jgi:hypothetical protein